MSLSKQLIILVSIIFFAIFTLDFFMSLSNIKSYLQEESKIHANDTATSLGLSLSPYMADTSDQMIESMISSIFDMGYFKEIRLEDMDGKTIIQKVNPGTFTSIPSWFSKLFLIETAQAQREISSGWSIAGTIYVTSNPGYGYLKLYAQAKNSIIYSSMALASAIVVLFIIMRFILKPLHKIKEQANNIAEGNFTKITELPYTTEIKSVAISMNTMSEKIEGIISKLNGRLDELNSKLDADALTGLKIRSSFEPDMKNILQDNGSGYLFLMKLDNLADFAKGKESSMVDSFIKDAANIMISIAKKHNPKKSVGYRFMGSEFVLNCRDIDKAQAEAIAKEISQTLPSLKTKHQKEDVAHIGITSYNFLWMINDIISALNEAVTQATLVGANSYYMRDDQDVVKTVNEWKELARETIEQERFDTKYLNQTFDKNGEIVIVESFADVHDANKNPLRIGTFISVSESYGFIAEFDKRMIERVVTKLNDEAPTYEIAINLSTTTIRDLNFKESIRKTLDQNSAIKSKLIFSISAYSAAKEIELVDDFCKMIKAKGAKTMLKRFDTSFLSLDALRNMKLDYLRLAREYTQNISNDMQKQEFVKTIIDFCEILGIKPIAEAVKSEEDYNFLKTTSIHAASR